MEETPITNVVCPKCHTAVRSTDYFCFNCGNPLQVKPPGVGIMDQVLLYCGSILLPPMGIIWGLRYLRVSDAKSRVIGLVAIALTIIVIVVSVKIAMNIVGAVNAQMGSGFGSLEGF